MHYVVRYASSVDQIYGYLYYLRLYSMVRLLAGIHGRLCMLCYSNCLTEIYQPELRF